MSAREFARWSHAYYCGHGLYMVPSDASEVKCVWQFAGPSDTSIHALIRAKVTEGRRARGHMRRARR